MTKVKFSTIGLILVLFGVLMLGSLSFSGLQLNGDQILQKVDDKSEETMSGNTTMTVRFDNLYSDGTKGHNIFGSLSKSVEGKPDKMLMYYKEPEDVKGTIFLSIDPVDPDANTKLFLYLPALGQVKELISESQRSGSFAGSTMSYEQIGEQEMSEDYNAQIAGEDILKVDGKSYPVYVLDLTAKPDADVDYPTRKSWVAKDIWVSLKGESYNEAGNLEQTKEVLKLGKFEGKVVSDKMISENVLEDSSTTITFIKRTRPDKEIPDSVFDSENLSEFDPEEWGL